jgi:hypothetical protein
LHKFQGQSAGEVEAGKAPNATPVIVCDPDIKQVEGRSTGFFYTMLSRATTFGDESGLNSAIYFIGSNLTKERLQRLTLRSDSDNTLVNVQRRTEWVEHLQQNAVDLSQITQAEMDDLYYGWTMGSPIQYDTLYTRTQQYITACNSQCT